MTHPSDPHAGNRDSWTRWFLIPFAAATAIATLAMLVVSLVLDLEILGFALIAEAFVAPSVMIYLLVRRYSDGARRAKLIYVSSLLPMTAYCTFVMLTSSEAASLGRWMLGFYLLAAAIGCAAMRWTLRSKPAD